MTENPWKKDEEQVKEMEKAEADQKVSKNDLRDISLISAIASCANGMSITMAVGKMYKSNVDVDFVLAKLKSITDHIIDIQTDIEHRIKENSKNG